MVGSRAAVGARQGAELGPQQVHEGVERVEQVGDLFAAAQTDAQVLPEV